ncbi:MAG TPA: hypothetical protein VK986_03945, partial [Tepidisphaeraceae bacterium]|nr:hypothetical protein [Tepidisphaeraceae bacterium]
PPTSPPTTPPDPTPTTGGPTTPPPVPAGPPLTLTEKRIKSLRNLTRISAALTDYRKKHAGAFPDSLQSLVDAGLTPADTIASPFGARSQYVTKSSKRIAKDLPANYVLAYDGAQTAEDPQQRAAVLWGNGKVEMVGSDALLKAVGETEKLFESLTK